MRMTATNIPSITPTEFIGGIFPRRQISIIASEPGCGKTWLMMKFCADISNEYWYKKLFGLSFNERERKCLLLIGDTGKEMIIDRLNLLDLKYIKGNNFVMYFVSDMIQEKHPFLLNTEEGRGAIEGLIAHEKPDIVFIDTLISFITADENSAKEIGEVFIGLRTMAEMQNCAIVLNHHLRKNATRGQSYTTKTTSLNDVIGSSAMSRLASLMIALTRDRTNPQRNRVNVFSVKTWYKEMPMWSFELQEEKEDGNKFVRITPDYTQGNILKLRTMLQNIAEQFQEGQIISFDELADMTCVPRINVEAALRGMHEFTPLTPAPTCDRVYITKTQGG